MRDYEELVRCLRGHSQKMGCADNCICEDADERGFGTCSEELAKLAADAIEELQRQIIVTKKCYQMMAEAYEAEVTKPKWISVDERPTKNVCDDGYTGYLVFSDGYIKVADYTCGFYVEGEYDPNVTHYMPLPKPPKESINDSR